MELETECLQYFTHEAYQRHNRRRQEHLASLMLPLAGKSVLELGAGIGDHTSFFLDRNCRVTVTDTREENLAQVRNRFPSVSTLIVDVESEFPAELSSHDVVYAYGLLYHLAEPEAALTRMASLTKDMLLLETYVSFGAIEAVNQIDEDSNDFFQAAHSVGRWPTRPWIFNALKRLFKYVYGPKTQPWHEEFQTDWLAAPLVKVTGLYRSIFIASRRPLAGPLLGNELLVMQERK